MHINFIYRMYDCMYIYTEDRVSHLVVLVCADNNLLLWLAIMCCIYELGTQLILVSMASASLGRDIGRLDATSPTPWNQSEHLLWSERVVCDFSQPECHLCHFKF